MPRKARPADASGNAAKIATGEIQDIATKYAKNAAAVALGRMGGSSLLTASDCCESLLSEESPRK